MYFFIQYSTFVRLSSPVPLGGVPGAGRTMGVAAGWFFPLVTAGQVILNVHTLIELGCREGGLMRSTLAVTVCSHLGCWKERSCPPLLGKLLLFRFSSSWRRGEVTKCIPSINSTLTSSVLFTKLLF